LVLPWKDNESLSKEYRWLLQLKIRNLYSIGSWFP
jgi:hypothetical protein